jgi:4,5-DOPA dioxygenase extradiol
MNRKQFFKILSTLYLQGAAMKLNALYSVGQNLPKTERMPVLFLGHGSPMNAIEENQFVSGFRTVAKSLAVTFVPFVYQ